MLLDGDQVNDSMVIVDRIVNEKREMERKAAAGADGKGKARNSPASSAPFSQPVSLPQLPLAGAPRFGFQGWFSGKSGAHEAAPARTAEEKQWREWVYETFVKVITVNIYR